MHYLSQACLIILVAVLLPAGTAEPLWTYPSPGSTLGSVSVSADGSAIAVGLIKNGCSPGPGYSLPRNPSASR